MGKRGVKKHSTYIIIGITKIWCLAAADGPFELTTVGSILELDECPGDESADDIPMNAADE